MQRIRNNAVIKYNEYKKVHDRQKQQLRVKMKTLEKATD
jgi:hypothetical protein